MPIKTDLHQIRGMQRDFSVSKASNEFAFDAMNIRLTARNGNTLLSVTNEKGNKESNIYSLGNPVTIEGTVIGKEVINKYLVLFTTNTDINAEYKDRIYRLEKDINGFTCTELYKGDLNFNVENPIESLAVFENDDVQKVYWTDNRNQPRVINIVSPNMFSWNNNSFDFVQDLELNEEINIVRKELSSGSFPQGVIQYAFTYYNKYGQETNIFYTSSLYYLSASERGSSPEDRVSNSFNITIKNVDTRFEYIRIYSIHRTSIDAVPTVKNIIDLPLEGIVDNKVNYVDNGVLGTQVDPTELLYIGGEDIKVGTMTQKDNTLFLGDITLNRQSIPEEIKSKIDLRGKSYSTIISSGIRTISKEINFKDSYYKYSNFLSEGNTAGFKAGEHYRLGIQFQHKTGKWSEPVFIVDYTVSDDTRPNLTTSGELNTLSIPKINYNLDAQISKDIKDLGYKRARAVVVLPSMQDRKIIVQGMLCPTVFNVGSRNNNTPFSQSSWFLRPFLPWNIDFSNDKMNNNKDIDKGAWVEFRHHYGVFTGKDRGAEIQNIDHSHISKGYDLNTINADPEKYSDLFLVDQSILTMHSPDIEFDPSLQLLNYADLKLRIVGAIKFTSSVGDIDIQTSTPVAHPFNATGFVHRSLGVKDGSELAARSLVSGLFYKDWLIDDNGDSKYGYYTRQDIESSWMIYPWQKSGSINNDINRSDGARTSVLSKKKISNLKFSKENKWFASHNYWEAYSTTATINNGITNIQLFNSNEVQLIKVPIPENSSVSNINYYGNIDTLLSSKDNYKQYFAGARKSDGSPIIESIKDPVWYDASFNDVNLLHSGLITRIGDYETNLESPRDPVRMKYKSTPHFVFGLNYSSGSGSQVILPTTFGSGYSAVNTISDSTVPYWIKGTSSAPTPTLYTELKGVVAYDYDIYPSAREWYDGEYLYNSARRKLYAYTSAKVLSNPEFPFDEIYLGHMTSWLFKYYEESTGITYYYDVRRDGDEYYLYNYDKSNSNDKEFGIKQDVITERVDKPYLFLAELYRDITDIVNPFGGDTADAFKSNQWIPAGNPVTLSDTGNTIEFIYGDTWYQRYDCLKTYPFTLEDENSIVEIGSFMCETRVNIDGRYDKNRGQISNLVMTPNNFNLLNPVYTQKNNFFNYRMLDEDFYKLNKFASTITWTKEKNSGAEIDAWTNITMASTLDLDGDRGEISALKTFNNEIFCFQKKGISNVLFNSRVQIPTSDGVPIEITNGLKVQGKRYISNIGCDNKWSIAESPIGLYFIDNNTNDIYLFNGQILNLSAKMSFSNWMKEHTHLNKWNPVTFKNFRTHYDNVNGDVYFIDDTNCLCYSEVLEQFTSFMSYEGTPYMFNIDNNFYAIKNNKVWEQFAGDYNSFYGETKPYSITVISNPDSFYDKIFNNIEFRADTWDNDKLLNTTFDTLEVWNEYQHGKTSLVNTIGRPSSLKKKFRVWRANIPRDSHNMRDRIRNTWAYVKLEHKNPSNYKTEFHDLMVHYFI